MIFLPPSLTPPPVWQKTPLFYVFFRTPFLMSEYWFLDGVKLRSSNQWPRCSVPTMCPPHSKGFYNSPQSRDCNAGKKRECNAGKKRVQCGALITSPGHADALKWSLSLCIQLYSIAKLLRLIPW